jgi:hypothetical protein
LKKQQTNTKGKPMKSLKHKIIELLRTRILGIDSLAHESKEAVITPTDSIAQLNPHSMYEFNSFNFWQNDVYAEEN